MWDGNKPLHEWKEFDAKESNADDLITWIFNENNYSPTAKIKGSKKFSIIADHLGTPLRGYNETGDLIWNRDLDSYGRVRMLEGEEGFCNYLYQGQDYDKDIDLTYNRFRWYNQEEGIYISQDMIGLWGGCALYSYVLDINTHLDIFGLVDGGSYYQVRSSNIGGEVHHIPANSVNGLSHSQGPSVWMTKSDHALTGSHGSQGLSGKLYRYQQSQHIANGRFDKAMEMDINDIKGKFGNKYDKGLIEAIHYAKDKGLITDSQAKRLRKKCK